MARKTIAPIPYGRLLPISIFVNGLGPVSPAQTTGAIATAPPVELSHSFTVSIPGGNSSLATTTTVPGSIVGVAQVQVQLPAKVGSVQPLLLQLEGSPLPEQPLIIWTTPTPDFLSAPMHSKTMPNQR